MCRTDDYAGNKGETLAVISPGSGRVMNSVPPFSAGAAGHRPGKGLNAHGIEDL